MPGILVCSRALGGRPADRSSDLPCVGNTCGAGAAPHGSRWSAAGPRPSLCPPVCPAGEACSGDVDVVLGLSAHRRSSHLSIATESNLPSPRLCDVQVGQTPGPAYLSLGSALCRAWPRGPRAGGGGPCPHAWVKARTCPRVSSWERVASGASVGLSREGSPGRLSGPSPACSRVALGQLRGVS